MQRITAHIPSLLLFYGSRHTCHVWRTCPGLNKGMNDIDIDFEKNSTILFLRNVSMLSKVQL